MNAARQYFPGCEPGASRFPGDALIDVEAARQGRTAIEIVTAQFGAVVESPCFCQECDNARLQEQAIIDASSVEKGTTP